MLKTVDTVGLTLPFRRFLTIITSVPKQSLQGFEKEWHRRLVTAQTILALSSN